MGVIPLEGKRHSPSIYLARYSSFLLFIHAKPFCKGGITTLVLKMGKWVEEVNWQGQDFAEVVLEFRFVHRSAGIHHSTPNLWLPFTGTLTALTLRGLISWAWWVLAPVGIQVEHLQHLSRWLSLSRSNTDAVIFCVLVATANQATKAEAPWYPLSPSTFPSCFPPARSSVWILHCSDEWPWCLKSLP